MKSNFGKKSGNVFYQCIKLRPIRLQNKSLITKFSLTVPEILNIYLGALL